VIVLHVVFKVGSAEYAMPAGQVLQMESYSGATTVPGAPPYVLGIVQVRGRVVPVINLRARFGLPDVAPTLDSRIVVGQDGERPVALLVDSAREVVNLAEDQLEAPPAILVEESQGYVKSVARLGARLLMVIDFHNVIGEESLGG